MDRKNGSMTMNVKMHYDDMVSTKPSLLLDLNMNRNMKEDELTCQNIYIRLIMFEKIWIMRGHYSYHNCLCFMKPS